MMKDTGKDYGNIKFNDIEEQMLIRHQASINEWIHKEIIPRMPHESKIKIGFGGTHYGNYKSCDRYTLVVYSEPNWFCALPSCGRREDNIQIGLVEMFGIGSPDNMESGWTANNPYNILPIVDNWHYIKDQLLFEVGRLEKEHSIIFNFEV